MSDVLNSDGECWMQGCERDYTVVFELPAKDYLLGYCPGHSKEVEPLATREVDISETAPDRTEMEDS